jgi:hypothetical protein
VRSRGSALAGEPTAWPQPEQNRALGDSDLPHAGQTAATRGDPQLEQNFPPPGTPQDGQALGDVLVMLTKLADSGWVAWQQVLVLSSVGWRPEKSDIFCRDFAS